MFWNSWYFEGAARVIDFSKIEEYKFRFPKDNNNGFFENLEKLDKKLKEDHNYSEAYKIYRSFINFEDRLWSDCLFLVLCDFAINMPLPPLDRDRIIFGLVSPNCFLPQNRFVTLCSILREYVNDNGVIGIKRNDELHELVEQNGYTIIELDYNSIDDWNQLIVSFYEFVEEKSSLPSPLTLAKEFLSILKDAEETQNNLYTLNNFLKKFKTACEIRLECPAFICHPQLVNMLDRKMYLKLSNQLGSSIMSIDERVRIRENFDAYDVTSDITRHIYITVLNNLYFKDKISISDIISKIPEVKEEDVMYVINKLFGDIIHNYLSS